MKSSKIRNVVFLVVTLLVPIFAGSEEKSVPNFDMMLRPTIEVYAEEVANCDVSDLDFSQGLVSVQNICQELMDSPICQDIDKQYRMDCSNIKLDPEERMDFSDKPGDTRIASEEYELDHGADTAMGEGVSIVWNCLKGGGQFVANLFGALLSLVQGAAILTISSFTETEAEKELFDNFKGLKNYLATEIEKEELKTEAEGRSSFPMVSALWNIIWDGIKTRYWKNFACLSAEGRNKLICEATTEIAAIAATGAFAGGTKVLGAAWNTLKAPRAAIKTVVDKNPLGKAAKSRRRAKKEAKPKVKQARKDVSKAETALKQARKKVSKSQRNRVLRPLMSKEKALVKASDKKDSALLAVKQAEKSLRDARVGVYRMAPGRAKRKAESRVRKAEANLKKAQEKLAMAERSERKAKGAIKTFRENRAKNKLAKKEAKKAEKDVNKAIKALSVQEKTKAKAVGQPSQKRLEQRELAKSEARQALAQAESSLESARKAVEKAVPGSRGERLALARLEKAESNLNLTKKKLRIKQTATPKGTSKPVSAETKPSTPAPKDTSPGTSAEQAAKRSASAKKAAETRKRNQQAKAQSTAPKTSAKKGDTETPSSTPEVQAKTPAQKAAETRRRNQQARAEQARAEVEVTQQQNKLVEDLTGVWATRKALDAAETAAKQAKGTPQARSASGRLGNATARYNKAKAKKEAIEKAHQVGKGQKGKDGKPAGVTIGKDGSVTGNFTPAQIRKKREILKEAGFKDAEIRQLMDSGAVGLMQKAVETARSGIQTAGTAAGNVAEAGARAVGKGAKAVGTPVVNTVRGGTQAVAGKTRSVATRKGRAEARVNRGKKAEQDLANMAKKPEVEAKFQQANQTLKEANDNVKNIRREIRQAQRAVAKAEGRAKGPAKARVTRLNKKLESAQATAKKAKESVAEARSALRQVGGNPNLVQVSGAVREGAGTVRSGVGSAGSTVGNVAGAGARAVGKGAKTVTNPVVNTVSSGFRVVGGKLRRTFTPTGRTQRRVVAQQEKLIDDLTGVEEASKALRLARLEKKKAVGKAKGPASAKVTRLEKKLEKAKAKRSAIEEAHQVGKGQLGKDGNPAGVTIGRDGSVTGNFTPAQIRQKRRILKEAGFTKEQSKQLMDSGAVGLMQKAVETARSGIQATSTAVGNVAGAGAKAVGNVAQKGAGAIGQGAKAVGTPVVNTVRGGTQAVAGKTRSVATRKGRAEARVNRGKKAEQDLANMAKKPEVEAKFQQANQTLKEANDNVKNIRREIRQAQRAVAKAEGRAKGSAKARVTRLNKKLESAQAVAKKAKESVAEARSALKQVGGNPNLVQVSGAVREGAGTVRSGVGSAGSTVGNVAGAGASAVGKGAKAVGNVARKGSRAVEQGAKVVGTPVVNTVRGGVQSVARRVTPTGRAQRRAVAQQKKIIEDLTGVQAAQKALKQAQTAAKKAEGKAKGPAKARVTRLEKKLEKAQAKRLAIEKAHQVGKGQKGKDGKPAGVTIGKDGSVTGNFTPAQIRQKRRILKEAGFTKEQSKQLMDSGAVGLMQKAVETARSGIQTAGTATGNVAVAGARAVGKGVKAVADPVGKGAKAVGTPVVNTVRGGTQAVAGKTRSVATRKGRAEARVNRGKKAEQDLANMAKKPEVEAKFQQANQTLKEANDNVKNIRREIRQAQRAVAKAEGRAKGSAKARVTRLNKKLESAQAVAKKAKESVAEARSALKQVGGNPNLVQVSGAVREGAGAVRSGVGSAGSTVGNVAGAGASAVGKGAKVVGNVARKGSRAVEQGAKVVGTPVVNTVRGGVQSVARRVTPTGRAQRRAVAQQKKIIEDLTGVQATQKALKQAQTAAKKAEGKAKGPAKARVTRLEKKLEKAQAKRLAIEKAHQVGKGQKGKDGKPAGVTIGKDGSVTGNFTPAQIRQKRRILKEAGFTKEQSKQLMDSGAVGLMQRPNPLANKALRRAYRKRKSDEDPFLRTVGTEKHKRAIKVYGKARNRYGKVNQALNVLQRRIEAVKKNPSRRNKKALAQSKERLNRTLIQAESSLESARKTVKDLAWGITDEYPYKVTPIRGKSLVLTELRKMQSNVNTLKTEAGNFAQLERRLERAKASQSKAKLKPDGKKDIEGFVMTPGEKAGAVITGVYGGIGWGFYELFDDDEEDNEKDGSEE